MQKKEVKIKFMYLLCLCASDDMGEKELEIKLDITKKSRRINRPVQFADQHGETKSIIEINDPVCSIT